MIVGKSISLLLLFIYMAFPSGKPNEHRLLYTFKEVWIYDVQNPPLRWTIPAKLNVYTDSWEIIPNGSDLPAMFLSGDIDPEPILEFSEWPGSESMVCVILDFPSRKVYFSLPPGNDFVDEAEIWGRLRLLVSKEEMLSCLETRAKYLKEIGQ